MRVRRALPIVVVFPATVFLAVSCTRTTDAGITGLVGLKQDRGDPAARSLA